MSHWLQSGRAIYGKRVAACRVPLPNGEVCVITQAEFAEREAFRAQHTITTPRKGVDEFGPDAIGTDYEPCPEPVPTPYGFRFRDQRHELAFIMGDEALEWMDANAVAPWHLAPDHALTFDDDTDETMFRLAFGIAGER